MSIDVTVVDISDFVGRFAAWVRDDELYMTDVQSMVNNVIGHVRSERQTIRRLSIYDHGQMTNVRIGRKSRAEFQIGSDVINPGNLASFKPQLARLARHFHPIDGHVWMTHCQIGNDLTLLLRLAKMLRVPVYAGKGLQNPVTGLNLPGLRVRPVKIGGKSYGPYWVADLRPGRYAEWEQYVRVDPDGTYRECMRPGLDTALIRGERLYHYVKRKLDRAADSVWP